MVYYVTMSRVPVCSLILVLATGCYLSGGRGGDAPVDASTGEDVAVACEEAKLRTSGMAEPFAVGGRCEFLVVCSSEIITGRLAEEIVVRFPSMTCSPRPDYSCDADAASSCIAYVGTLDAEQYAAGCELTRMEEVTSVVCAGDL